MQMSRSNCQDGKRTCCSRVAGFHKAAVHLGGNNAVQDFYTHVVDYIAESDALNGTAFSNAALHPGGASAPLSGGGNAQLEGLPKLVMQVPPASI
jgi:hypothetical protein